ncbi:MAG: hypothetical protein Q8P49_01585 [Candidatus Liptonbacteria bacterium]|nr:hypothetical protein [Candidatus Liptonbacteria bacterium]
MVQYLERVQKKYRKTKGNTGVFVAFFFMFFFIFRDIILSVLVELIPSKSGTGKKGSILFIEPIQQGYGDMFFQTGLFENWKADGYQVGVLTSNDHAQILENNHDIGSIYTWSLSHTLEIMKKPFIVVGLGRDTFKETLFMLLLIRSTKIVFDKNLKIWRDTFSEVGTTLAWQRLSERYIGTNFNSHKPKICFSSNEEDEIYKSKNLTRIGVVLGVETHSKEFRGTEKLISAIGKAKHDIFLFGKGKLSIKIPRSAANFVNKLSYRRTIVEIAKCGVLIGPEGSLTQIASTLCSKVIIVEGAERFKKNTHPFFLGRAALLISPTVAETIKRALQHL